MMPISSRKNWVVSRGVLGKYMGDIIHNVHLWKMGLVRVIQEDMRKRSARIAGLTDYLRQLPNETEASSGKESLVLQR